MTPHFESDQDEGAKVISAIQAYAMTRESHYAAKAIYRLQRIPSGGAHPYGWPIGSVWNAYSWDVQNGSGEFSDTIIDLVEDVVKDVVGQIPPEELTLLALAATGITPNDATDYFADILESIMSEVGAIASQRNMERYDPDYRWYENI